MERSGSSPLRRLRRHDSDTTVRKVGSTAPDDTNESCRRPRCRLSCRGSAPGGIARESVRTHGPTLVAQVGARGVPQLRTAFSR